MRFHWAVWASLCATPAAAAQVTPPSPPAQNESSAPPTVVVTGKTPPVVHKIDRSIYNVKNSPQAETGTLSDILNTLPSVNVTSDGAVTVRGGSVQILVDGKPSAALQGASLATALRSMPANTIDRIEVITNPGAEFRADAAAVINIITRKRRGSKLAGDLIVNAGPALRANATLSGSVGIGKWTFNGSLSDRQDAHKSEMTADRRGLDPSNGSVISRMLQHQIDSGRSRFRSLDASATYVADDRDSFGINAHLMDFRGTQKIKSTMIFVDSAGNPITDTISEFSVPFAFKNHALTGTWKHQGKHDGETFTLVARHDNTDTFSDQHFLDRQRLPPVSSQTYRRRNSGSVRADELSGDYVLPLAQDTQFKAGFDIENDRNQSDYLGTNIDAVSGTETIDPAFTSLFISDRTLSAAYVDYQQPVGKWLIEGGLRVENLTTRLGASRGALAPVASDLEWSPSLFFSRELTTHQKLRFTYSRRIDRPDASLLNPAPQQHAAVDVFVGNPSLRPARTDSFEAGYDYTTQPVTFGGTAYVRRTHNAITQYSYYGGPGDTVLVSSFENAGAGSRAGLDMSLDLRPSPRMAYSLSTDIYRDALTAPINGVPLRRSIVSHLTKATITLTPTTPDMFQVMYTVSGPGLLADGQVSSSSTLDLSYTHTLSKRLKFVVTANNVLTTARLGEIQDTPRLHNDVRSRPREDMIYVGLACKLGAVEGR